MNRIRQSAFLLALVVSDVALACPVCGGGGANRDAFVQTMVFMTLMPLIMLGGFAAFLVWRARMLDAEKHQPMSRLADSINAEPAPPMNPANIARGKP